MGAISNLIRFRTYFLKINLSCRLYLVLNIYFMDFMDYDIEALKFQIGWNFYVAFIYIFLIIQNKFGRYRSKHNKHLKTNFGKSTWCLWFIASKTSRGYSRNRYFFFLSEHCSESLYSGNKVTKLTVISIFDSGKRICTPSKNHESSRHPEINLWSLSSLHHSFFWIRIGQMLQIAVNIDFLLLNLF